MLQTEQGEVGWANVWKTYIYSLTYVNKLFGTTFLCDLSQNLFVIVMYKCRDFLSLIVENNAFVMSVCDISRKFITNHKNAKVIHTKSVRKFRSLSR